MDANSWARFAASSRRHQNVQQSRFDPYMECDEVDGGEDEARAEFACPFCAEDFDIVGLCCHIDDEHPVEARNGVCPVCEARVGVDMVGHITMQHANFFKLASSDVLLLCLTHAHMQRRRRHRKGSLGSYSTFSLLKKELREGHLQSLLGGSSFTVPASNAAADPWLSSFIYNFPVANSSKDVQLQKLDEGSSTTKGLNGKTVESVESTLSVKDQEEKARRSEFVRELMLSTIFADAL